MLGDRRIDSLTPADVAALVAAGVKDENARETIRKTVTALAMILDFVGVSPNPARDRVHVRLPREEPEAMEPPTAAQVEAVGWLLQPAYLLAVLVLDATGARVGELEAARIGDLDETRRAWLVRAAVAKTRRPRWVTLPDLITADTYTHAMIDGREVDRAKLLERVCPVQTPVQTSRVEDPSFAGAF